MKLVNTELVKEFALEMGRVALVAVLPVVIVSLEAGEVDYKLILITAVVAVLKSADRALHESKVATKGLLRF